MRLAPRVLEGFGLRLEPITQAHRAGLRPATLDPGTPDPGTWRFFPDGGGPDVFDAMFDRRLASHAANEWIVFCIRQAVDGRLIGQSCYLNLSPRDARVEIGGTWFEVAARGGFANPASKYVLLQHAFAAGARRVEFKIDARNERSRAALLKLGAREEGALRRHTQMWDGHVRDTAYFIILDTEWPAVRAALEERLRKFDI